MITAAAVIDALVKLEQEKVEEQAEGEAMEKKKENTVNKEKV